MTPTNTDLAVKHNFLPSETIDLLVTTIFLFATATKIEIEGIFIPFFEFFKEYFVIPTAQCGFLGDNYYCLDELIQN